MAFKLFYDGNPAHTRVMDAQTGEPIDGIVSAHVDIDVDGGLLTLVFNDFEAEISNIEESDEDSQGIYRGGSDRDSLQNIEQTSKQV